jgi:hypothetical protein
MRVRASFNGSGPEAGDLRRTSIEPIWEECLELLEADPEGITGFR